MNEAQRKAKLVEEINALGGYAHRWEDRYRVGLLDLVLKLPDPFPIIWAEGKVIKGNVFAPTERQFEEGQKIIRAGMKALLIGWKDKTMYVSPWAPWALREECFSGPARVATLVEYLNESR